MKDFDVIIIGFGKGGKTLALEFAKHGSQVALTERSKKMYGGTCINVGCIPSKTLVHQAKIASEMTNVSFQEKAQFYRHAIYLKEEVTTTLREKNYYNLASHPNITIFDGITSFIDSNKLLVKNDKEELILQSNNIIINTGAETIIPKIEGVENNPFVYTSASIMELKSLPRHLAIVGGGYVGLEFASIYASFGSKVTILDSYSQLIVREDRDIASSVKQVLEKKGINFRMNAKVQSITASQEIANINFTDAETGKQSTIQADAVLLATGRQPNSKELNLAAAAVAVNEQGAIIVDQYLVTTNPLIRAVGDIKGGLQFTYISLDDYRIVRDDFFGDKTRSTKDRSPVSYSVFIDPPLSHIGMNEENARKLNLDVTIRKIPVAAIPKAKTIAESDGMLKAIIDNNTKKIIGCTLFAPDSSEIINIVALAMKMGVDYTFLRDFIFTHPSMSEALNELFTL